MNDHNDDASSTSLISVGSALSGVPEPLQTSFIAATSRMLGGLAAYPAAWLRRGSQSVEDTTDARTIVAKGLAEEALRQAKNDPVIMQAATEVYLPEAVRKVTNRANTTAIAAEEISRSGNDGSKAAPPDDDWMNAFMRFSEGASSERLQLLFGKILAGEICTPGSFSPSTLRMVSELTQAVAKDFEWLWAMDFGKGAHYSDALDKSPGWPKLCRLRDAGLVSPQNSIISQPKTDLQAAIGGGNVRLLFVMSSPGTFRLQFVTFTQTGQELGSLLPAPDHAANLRSIAELLSKKHMLSITLLTPSSSELLWDAAKSA